VNRGEVSLSFDRGDLIDVDTDALREEFHRFRRQRHVSQAGVAKLLNVSQATISSFEQGKHNHIRAKTLHGIYDVVQFWKRDASGTAKNSNSSRSVVRPRLLDAPLSGKCAHCDAQIPSQLESALFCPSCGHPLRAPCSCGHYIIDRQALFCSRCGVPVDAPVKAVLNSVNRDLRVALLRSVVRWIEHRDPIGQILRDLSALAASGEDG